MNSDLKRPPSTEGPFQSPYLYMLSGAFSFAVMGTLSHLAGERVSWQPLAVARTCVAFVLSLCLCLLFRVKLVVFKPALLWLRSIAGSFGILALFYALPRLPVSTVLTLSNTAPVWVTLLAWPVLKQRPTVSMWLAILLSILGVVLIQNPNASGEHLAGLLALAHAAFTAVAMIGLNKLGGVDSRAVVTHFSGVSSLFTLAVLLISGNTVDYSPLQGGSTILMLAGVGVTGMLAQLAVTRAYALGNPPRISVIGLMQVVFALPFDIFLWHRTLGVATLIGIVLVVAPSGWLILQNPLKRTEHDARPNELTSSTPSAARNRPEA